MGLAGFSRLGVLQFTVHPLEILKHSEQRCVTVGLSGVELAAEPVWSLLKPTAQVEWIYGPLGLAYRYEESGEVNTSGTVAVLDCRSLRSPVGYFTDKWNNIYANEINDTNEPCQEDVLATDL